MDLTRKKPMQTVKMLNGANNMSKIICTFVFDTFCGPGRNCIFGIFHPPPPAPEKISVNIC